MRGHGLGFRVQGLGWPFGLRFRDVGCEGFGGWGRVSGRLEFAVVASGEFEATTAKGEAGSSHQKS